jgi:hypothetical protein
MAEPALSRAFPIAADSALEALVEHRRIRRAATAVAVALLAASCAGASDEPKPPPPPAAAGTSAPVSPAPSTPTAAPEVAAEDAVAIALDTVGGGQVLETDADEFHLVIQVWEVTIVTPDGVRRQVSIDMRDGSVIGNEAED